VYAVAGIDAFAWRLYKPRSGMLTAPAVAVSRMRPSLLQVFEVELLEIKA